ncbi:MAG: SGNH/GDSL hydrolase family protein [Verrucomicrobiota bacterium]
MIKLSSHTVKNHFWVGCLALSLCMGCASSSHAQFTGKLSKNSKILVIGDSLTVGPFGDFMQEWLFSNLPQSQIAIYAACGSSPEHWMSNKPEFISPCGYRETTPSSKILTKYENGRKPVPTATPKIETLLMKFKPDVLIVQLGTNHFDTLEKDGDKAIPELQKIYRQFSQSIIANKGNLKMVYWITPPDASKYPAHIKTKVQKIIGENNRNHGFRDFYSYEKIPYSKGLSGSDGVHLNKEASRIWFSKVKVEFSKELRNRGLTLK